MTRAEFEQLEKIAEGNGWEARALLQNYLKTVEITVEPKGQRTSQQNRALHKGLLLLANVLNDAGLSMRVLLKPEVSIDWTTESVKEHLFRPFMKAMTGKQSTTELTKTGGEIEKVWDTLMRELGEKHGIEYIPFPSEAIRGVRLSAMDNYQKTDYPAYEGPVNFDA